MSTRDHGPREVRMTFKKGDWVRVKPEHDLPPILLPNGPTRGRVERVERDHVEVWVPIDGADVDEHSQSVPYPPEALELDHA